MIDRASHHLNGDEVVKVQTKNNHISQDLNSLFSKHQELQVLTPRYILLGGEKTMQSRKKSWNNKLKRMGKMILIKDWGKPEITNTNSLNLQLSTKDLQFINSNNKLPMTGLLDHLPSLVVNMRRSILLQSHNLVQAISLCLMLAPLLFMKWTGISIDLKVAHMEEKISATKGKKT